MKTFVKCNRRIALLLVLLLTTALLAGCTEDEPEIRKPYSKPVGNESTPTPEATATPTADPAVTGEPSPEPSATDAPTPGAVTESPTPEPTATLTIGPYTNTPTPGGATETPDPTGAATPTGATTPAATPTGLQATPTPNPIDTPTPTATPKPTNTPTPTKTPTPTNTPKPTATPTTAPKSSFGTKWADYDGMWYAYDILGVEASSPTLCKNDPDCDYRLVFDGEKVRLIHTPDHNPDSGAADNVEFSLVYTFSEKSRSMYESMGYGMTSYLDNPTDLSKGHLVYTCKDGSSSSMLALLIVDAQSDGTLKVAYRLVIDGGSYPVFVDYTFTRNPVFKEPDKYANYKGQWNCKTVWGVEAEEPTDCSKDPKCDYRLLFYDDYTATLIWAPDHDMTAGTTSHYEMRYSFSSAELEEYASWELGIDTMVEDNPTSFEKSHMVFRCTDKKFNGGLLIIDKNKDGTLNVEYWYFQKEASYIVHVTYTFTRDLVY